MPARSARQLHLLILLAFVVSGVFLSKSPDVEPAKDFADQGRKAMAVTLVGPVASPISPSDAAPISSVPGTMSPSNVLLPFVRMQTGDDRIRFAPHFAAFGTARPGTRVQLPLPNGVEAHVILERPANRAVNDFSWIGSVEGEPSSMVAMSVFEDAIAIQINSVTHGELTLQKVDEGVYRWHQPDPTVARCAVKGVTTTSARSAGFGDAPPTVADGEVAADGSGPNFDVVVIYTAAARVQVGGLSQITAMANNSVTSLNGTFTRSGVDATVTLVHLQETDYVEAGGEAVGTAFSRLTNPSDGHMDEAASLRDAYGADLVSLFMAGTNFGVGEINGFYSVVEADVASGVAPHEWGHNLGCGHDDINGPRGVYTYSYAHYFTLGGTQYGTIMSYIGQRVAYFSNPNVTYTAGANSTATGVANTRDHALTITNNGAAVAARRTLNLTDYDEDGVLNTDEPAGDLDGDLLVNDRDPDADGDGFNDGVEVAAGRDPYDAHLLFPFSTAGIFDNWTTNNVTSADVAGGIFSGTASTADSQLSRTGLDLDGSSNTLLRIRMTSSAATTVQLFWGTRDADNISGTRSLTAAYSTANVPQDIVFDLSGRADWIGKIVTRLRLDPGNTNAAAFAIDYIATTNGDFDADGVGDVAESLNDLDLDGQPDFADLDVDGDGTGDIPEITAGRDQRDGLFKFGFNTAADFEGWAAANHLTGTSVADGLLTAQLAGGDSQFRRSGLSFAAAPVTAAVVRMRSPGTVNAILFWSRANAGGFNAARSATGAYNGAGAWRTVLVDLAGHAEWNDQITQLRFDPTTVATGTVDIDFIEVSTGDYDGDGISDVVEGTIDTDNDTHPNFADLDSDNDLMPDAWEQINGFNRLLAADAALDFDSDGLTNFEEYIAGTSATQASDRPAAFSPVLSSGGTQFQLRIAGKAGRVYRLMRSPALGAAAEWTPVETIGPVAADGEISLTDGSPPASAAFYRVEITLP